MSAPALWTRHRTLARAIARDWSIPGWERQDVEQEAMVALWEAARAWRPDGGASFPAFARQVISRRLTDALRAEQRWKRRPLNESLRVVENVDDGSLESIVETLPHWHQVADVAEDRESLRAVVRIIRDGLTDFERHCVVGIATGVPYVELGPKKRVDNAASRARRKLKAAA